MRTERRGLVRVLALLLAAVMVSTVLLAASPADTWAASSKLKKSVTKVVKKQTKGMTDPEQKLDALFNYCVSTFRYKKAPGTYLVSIVKKGKLSKSQVSEAAYQMLKKKKGSCFHDAAAFAYLARYATKLPVRIVFGKSNVSNGYQATLSYHAWVEVKIGGVWYGYDTNGARNNAATAAQFKKMAAGTELMTHYQAGKTMKIKK